MEEEQKNENSTFVPQSGKQPEKEKKSKRGRLYFFTGSLPGHHLETSLPPNGNALRRGSHVRQDGAYHFFLCRPLCRLGKQSHHSGKGERGGKRNRGESHDRGLPGQNELLLRHLRGRQFLFIQRQVRP